MARYETNLDAAKAEPLSVAQVLALLDPPGIGGSARTEAVACFLAGAEGWEQAARKLGGAFAQCDSSPSGDQPPRVNR